MDIQTLRNWQGYKGVNPGVRQVMGEAADVIKRLRTVLFEVRSEVNLSKAPKLMGRIEAALGINQQTIPEKK